MIKINLEVIPRTKKNSQQIVYAKGRYIVIPSKAYQQFERDCLKQIKAIYRQKIDTPVNIQVTFYMPTRRKVDLTNLLEAVDDMLVKAEVIKDDNRDIVAGHDGSRVQYDKENPHIEIKIEKMQYYKQWREE